jgi:asparagine synthase (glutamine-hydrolysing)
MCDVQRHRGPDGEGYFVDSGVGLGMRRLSIIDLATGQQPITNETSSVWLVFNGEIYNHHELRRDLERLGHAFVTRSDSEVIVHAYEQYGDRCVEYFNGMFAFAVWDAPKRRLLLGRDRLGIKPLYYWADNRQLVFGSDLKVLLADPSVPREIDLVGLDLFLTFEYIPGPRTILQGVRKLLPGHTLVFQDGHANSTRYWAPPFEPVPDRAETCAEILTALIRDAVGLQLRSDVPLGAFLSGGIDSSSVVSFMGQAGTTIRTFSIGFDEGSYNELPYARAVSRHVGSVHEEEILKPDIGEMTLQLIDHLDEPLGDFSMIPTFLVSRLAKRSVKVVLSGDGGDELFAGYDTYVAQDVDQNYYRRLPGSLRQHVLPALMARIPPQASKKGLINKAKRFVEGAALPTALHHTRWMTFLSDEDKRALYGPALQLGLQHDGANWAAAIIEDYFNQVAHADPLAQQQYVDIKTYLVDDILTKVDRMSMANSLEARVPLLDHRIVEFALALPPHLKLDRGRTKMILRRAMAPYLPAPILDRPKQGFSIPIKEWLKGPLRPLLCETLSADRLRQRGYFNPACVTRWTTEHVSGVANHSHRLWPLIVFELWHERMLATGNASAKQAARV